MKRFLSSIYLNRLFRLLWLLIRYRWVSKCSPLGPCSTELRVWPNDLDLFFHVNNGVYFSLCDLARVDLMLRSRSLGLASGPRRPFLVAAETIQILRPLSLFQRFRIETRVIGWDERAFFVEHRFVIPASAARSIGESTIALVVVEGRVFDKKEGQVRPAALIAALGVGSESRDLPGWVQRWHADQQEIRAALRAHRGAAPESTAPVEP